jgi:hypothetical protein
LGTPKSERLDLTSASLHTMRSAAPTVTCCLTVTVIQVRSRAVRTARMDTRSGASSESASGIRVSQSHWAILARDFLQFRTGGRGVQMTRMGHWIPSFGQRPGRDGRPAVFRQRPGVAGNGVICSTAYGWGRAARAESAAETRTGGLGPPSSVSRTSITARRWW